jgi:hypothetical protein
MKILTVVLMSIFVLSVGSFALMIGFTDGVVSYAISVGTELTPSTFAYAGLSFPLGAMIGGGMKLGDLYNFDFGRATNGQEIGTFNIGYGAVADAEIYAFYGFYPAIFVGPALIFKADLPVISTKLLSYTAIGLGWPLTSSPRFSWATGWFYVF